MIKRYNKNGTDYYMLGGDHVVIIDAYNNELDIHESIVIPRKIFLKMAKAYKKVK